MHDLSQGGPEYYFVNYSYISDLCDVGPDHLYSSDVKYVLVISVPMI